MNLTPFVLLLLLLLTVPLTAQSPFDEVTANEPPSATAVRFSEGITLDGKLDELEWQNGEPARDFWETFPTDRQRSTYPTEIYFGYDDQNFYVAALCRTPGNTYIIPSLRRDYRAGGNDNITFVLNPFRDKTNAIVFGMNPYGVTREALIYNGGESTDDFREEWDNKWRGESYIGDGYWSCEMIIPFSSLRFPSGAAEWFFNSYRMDTQSNTRSTWHRIPQNQTIMSLAYMGSLRFEGGAPQAQGKNLVLIPYAGGSIRRDYQAETPTDFDGNLGGDAKVGIGSGLNLDLTVNPDFSQVEVDQQVINTTRFEVFFPERRQFFLENADLFGSFGFERANPFFSRRIGVTRDTTTGEGLQNPIYFGARLSGKLTDDLRVGLLNMQAAQNRDQGLPSFNYTVAALQQRVGARSNLGGIFVNKQNFTNFSDTTETNADFNRVVGLDYNLATRDNAWNGKTFLHRSFSDKEGGDDYTHGLNLEYRHRNWNVQYDQYLRRGGLQRRGGLRATAGLLLEWGGGGPHRLPQKPQCNHEGSLHRATRLLPAGRRAYRPHGLRRLRVALRQHQRAESGRGLQLYLPFRRFRPLPHRGHPTSRQSRLRRLGRFFQLPKRPPPQIQH